MPLKGIYVADNLGSGCEAQTSTAFNIMEICQEAPAAQKSTKLKELMKDDLKKEAEDILEMLTRKESSARVLLKEQPCSQAPLAV